MLKRFFSWEWDLIITTWKSGPLGKLLILIPFCWGVWFGYTHSPRF